MNEAPARDCQYLLSTVVYCCVRLFDRHNDTTKRAVTVSVVDNVNMKQLCVYMTSTDLTPETKTSIYLVVNSVLLC